MSEHINNRSKRQETLKGIIRRLHEGESVEQVKGAFATLLRDVGAGEIAEVEQALIAEGLPEIEIKRLCDVHVAVFRDSLDVQAPPEGRPGHPIHTFRAENEAVAGVLDALGGAIEAAHWAQARELVEKLREYDRHYVRKENILFPYLERHGFSAPSAVMWAIHDDVRAGWKDLAGLLAAEPVEARVTGVLDALDTAIRDMVYKEEHILFPTALEKLSAEEWAAIRAQTDEIGTCYVQPEDLQVQPVETTAPASASPEAVDGDLIPLSTGALTARQIDLMLTHLPVDVTFVDERDAVRFFSATPERIFPRSPAIVGRKVQKCHPPASVHRVQRIVDDFRAGSRDEAQFWIQMGPPDAGGKFIHIRYFALRDEDGTYRGTLEVSQDVTGIRALEGERRLLDEGA